ncbi:MAG TPA: phosphoribosylamine--glycine ligase [Candidatus Limnocylindrales bacterium]|nr:phosphoribosylamine--glycine ligase [Candidatus Limnocylindrales bacterium]
MPTRVLVLGGGGREHALAWKLAHEPGVNEVVVAPGSAGIAGEPRVRVEGVDAEDAGAVVALARRVSAELVVVGPEAPLAAGVADALVEARIAVFGPVRAAARIESSKAFCREVAESAGVPMARGGAFTGLGPALALATELAATGRGVVVKADGLMAGKGVTVCAGIEEAEAALRALFADPAGTPGDGGSAAPRVVVEERLSGPEASLIAICDGTDAFALPFARDHKRLLDGDAGPNTGGMGAYSPLPDLPDEAAPALVERFHVPVLRELARRGTPFTGALYAGLILTADGPVLLEFNARFGDPETQVLLPRLGVALGPLLLAAAHGRLAAAARPLGLPDRRLPATRDASVGIVLAAAGYPGMPRPGDPITGLDLARRTALVFHAGTAPDATGGFRTRGGRVLAVVGRGATLEEARAAADAAADAIDFDGRQRRRDIAAVLPAQPSVLGTPAASTGAGPVAAATPGARP